MKLICTQFLKIISVAIARKRREWPLHRPHTRVPTIDIVPSAAMVG